MTEKEFKESQDAIFIEGYHVHHDKLYKRSIEGMDMNCRCYYGSWDNGDLYITLTFSVDDGICRNYDKKVLAFSVKDADALETLITDCCEEIYKALC